MAATLEVAEELLDCDGRGNLLVKRRERGLPPLPLDGRVESAVDRGVKGQRHLAGQTRVRPAGRGIELHLQCRGNLDEATPALGVQQPPALEAADPGQIDRLPAQLDPFLRKLPVDPRQHPVGDVAQAGREVVVHEDLERRVSGARPVLAAQVP